MSRPRTGNKRQRLIDAAVRLFAHKGYFYTTTAEVSARAGVASGTLYLYFNSKDDLLAAALNEYLETFEREVIPCAGRADSASGRLAAFIREFTTFVARNQDLARVFFVESRQSNSALLSQASGAEARYFSLVRSFLVSSVCEQHPSEPAVETMTSLLLGVTEKVSVRWLLGHAPLPPAASADLLTEIMIGGIGSLALDTQMQPLSVKSD